MIDDKPIVIMTDDKPKSTSPLPEKKENENQMSFPEAIKQIILGKKITRLEWNNKEEYGVLKDTFLMLHKTDEKFYQWIVNDGDLLGTDWVVL